AGLSVGEGFIPSLIVLPDVIKSVDEKIALMMWADLLNSSQSGDTYGLSDVGDSIPAGIQSVGRVDLESVLEARERFTSLRAHVEVPMLVGVEGARGAVHAFAQLLARNGSSEGGIIALAEDEERVAATLNAAWTGPDSGGVWPRVLNGYFGADLMSPDYSAVHEALVRYLNEKTLEGQAPEEVYDAYDTFAERNRDLLERDEAGAKLVKTLLGQLTTYLALEERYSREGDEGLLRKLHKLVERIQENDPEASVERYQRILDTIAEQQLFVPASILFQADLRYFRPGRPTYPLYEVPSQPGYADTRGQVAATLDLMTGQAPVRRIDFEGLGVSALSVALSQDGRVFEEQQRWQGVGGLHEVRGPVLLKKPIRATGLRLTATCDRTPLVLRDVRLFAEKMPPVMTAHYAVQAPPMAAKFDGRAWARSPQGHSFLQRDEPQFAEAPTAVWVTHTRDALYVGIAASETRPEAIVADLTTRDAPLWEQESVEIWLHPKGRLPLRLIVNPLGTQYDSEAFDGGWDGDWSVVAEQNDHGWSAVVRIPARLVGDVKRGGSIPMNIVRNRLGVRKERSAWVHRYGAQPDLQWGELRFP
ncbi:MAG: hypothetical protein L3K26_09055, partial [Candidatus Hydrogenedentes bacterium]|nr:hypothetical protein [Candidatus Hydrogenedentota bacterium]